MYNEIFGVATFLVTFILMVIMFRCFGKQGLIAWVAIDQVKVTLPLNYWTQVVAAESSIIKQQPI